LRPDSDILPDSAPPTDARGEALPHQAQELQAKLEALEQAELFGSYGKGRHYHGLPAGRRAVL
jgi:hypothetical protein